MLHLAQVGAGKQRLHMLQAAEQPRAAAQVQLAQHVVQQQQGCVPLGLGQDVDFGQAQAEHRRSDLALRAEGAQLLPGQGE